MLRERGATAGFAGCRAHLLVGWQGQLELREDLPSISACVKKESVLWNCQAVLPQLLMQEREVKSPAVVSYQQRQGLLSCALSLNEVEKLLPRLPEHEVRTLVFIILMMTAHVEPILIKLSDLQVKV